MDAATVSILSGPAGTEIFERLADDYDADAAVRASTRLRDEGYPAELVAAALTQWELRTRARVKFGAKAAHMFFTRDGLEQSTRALVADLHAQRFARLGVRHIWDLGCGIGGDAVAYCRAGLDVTAIEADPLTAAVAMANLDAACADAQRGDLVPHTRHDGERDARCGSATVRTQHVQDVLAEVAQSPSHDEAVWLDPARRTPGVSDAAGRPRRIRSRAHMSPPWDVVEQAARCAPSAGVKVGASFNVDSLPADVQAQWISVDGSALECVLWWGRAAVPSSTRIASVHRLGAWHHLAPPSFEVGRHRDSAASTTQADLSAGSFVYEVDPAVLAAGMRDLVCAQVNGHRLGVAAYVWSPEQVATTWARCWRINEVLPVSVKALRGWAQRHEVGALTIKKPSSRSGSPLARLDPDRLRAKIGTHGSAAQTLMLTEVEDRGSAVAVAVSPVISAH